MEKSKYEKIARIIFVVSALTMLVSTAILRVGISAVPRASIPALIEVCWASQGVTVMAFAFFFLAAKKRLAGQREKFAQIVRDSALLPDFSRIDTSNAVVSLFWSVNYKSSFLLNLKYTMSSPRFWIGVSLLSILIIIPWVPEIGWDRPWLLAGVSLVAAAVMTAFYLFLIALTLKRHYIKGVHTMNVGLVVNNDGMHYLAGQTVLDLPWTELKSIKQLAGIIMMTHADGRRLIPDYGFHTQEDSKAFVALAIALKKGEAAPVHDWSNYKPQVPIEEGVWPPPVA